VDFHELPRHTPTIGRRGISNTPLMDTLEEEELERNNP